MLIYVLKKYVDRQVTASITVGDVGVDNLQYGGACLVDVSQVDDKSD